LSSGAAAGGVSKRALPRMTEAFNGIKKIRHPEEVAKAAVSKDALRSISREHEIRSAASTAA
jgi:hypothetical protein